MKFRLVFAIALGLAVLSKGAQLYEYDLDDPYSSALNGPIDIKVGDSVRFVVDENLSTGYEWKYRI